MKILPKPLPGIKAEDIFEECVTGYRSKEKQTSLLQCKDLICVDSKLYDICIPQSLNKFSASKLPNDITNKDLYSVYTDKFADEDGPGRKYYNSIKAQAVRGICPICGIRMVSTLDHYLPKSKVPTLSVTPNNLIPSCRDCNMDKQAEITCNPLEAPIHLYFDEVPNEPWLFVRLKENLEAIYYISCPDSWELGIRSRLEKHLGFYKLHALYSSHAAQEIADRISGWQIFSAQVGMEKLKEHLEFECISIEKNDLNSWKAALYRGLLSDFDKVEAYLLNTKLF